MKKNQKKNPVCGIPAAARFTVELVESKNLFICGCTGIVSYSDTDVRLATRSQTVAVSGIGLSLGWAGEGKLLLTGTVRTVSFL